MNFLAIFNIIDFFQFFVEYNHQLVIALIFLRYFQNRKKKKFIRILKYRQTNLQWKENRLPNCLLDNYVLFYQFLDNFLALLLYKMNFLEIFNIVDSFQIFDEHKHQ